MTECGEEKGNGETCTFYPKYPDDKCGHHTEHDTGAEHTVGRPSKLNGNLIAKFVECIENGMSISMTAKEVGVTASTFYYWIEKARDNPDSKYADFKSAYDSVWYDEYDHQKHMRRIKAAHYSGEQSAHWKGGQRDYRGPNWHVQRKRALERAQYTCESCGISDKEHRTKHDYGLHVHHITARREFANDDPKQNHLSNLTVLCHQCHEMYEGSNLSPVERGHA